MLTATQTDPKFEVICEIGRGGMGRVFLARTRGIAGFERLVALKRLRPELTVRADLLGRFTAEARLAAYVRHANVVSVHELGCDDEGHYLVLDYVEGANLEGLVYAMVECAGRIPPPIVLRIIADAAAGLHAVHHATDPCGRPLSILHRDVSIQNILVGCDGMSRLTDFGIARSILADAGTERHRLLGKLAYASPEYVTHRPVDGRLDIYALGITMWIAMTGCEPWFELREAELYDAIVRGVVPSFESTGLVAAPALEEIVSRACARDPEDRFRTAAEMADSIERLGRETGWLASHSEVASFVQDVERSRLSDLHARIRDYFAVRREPAHEHLEVTAVAS